MRVSPLALAAAFSALLAAQALAQTAPASSPPNPGVNGSASVQRSGEPAKADPDLVVGAVKPDTSNGTVSEKPVAPSAPTPK
jgi:outer membrane protein TolC